MSQRYPKSSASDSEGRDWVSEIRKKNIKISEKLGVGVLPRSGKKTKAGKKFGGRSPGGRLGKIHHRVCNFFPDPQPIQPIF